MRAIRRIDPANALFWGVMAMYPGFVLQPSAFLALLEAAAFFVFSAKLRGRARPIPSLVTVLGIAAFNLLTPVGRVMVRFGEFAVTLGALETGLRKGAILAGMVQLSRAAVSDDLKIPGKPGEFLALVFRYFDRITEEPLHLKDGGVARQIDIIAAKVYLGEESEELHHDPESRRSRRTSKHGATREPSSTLLALIVASTWALLALGFIFPSADDLLRLLDAFRVGTPLP